jgi:bifunctional ADP-heptose synthase (sugar kinase/adenylyltransferase)
MANYNSKVLVSAQESAGNRKVKYITNKKLKESLIALDEYDQQKRIAELNIKEQKQIISQIARNILDDLGVDTKTINLRAYDTQTTISFGESITISNEAAAIVHSKFGKDSDMYLKQKVSFTPTKELLELALDDEELEELLTKKEKSPAFKLTKLDQRDDGYETRPDDDELEMVQI